MTRYELYKQLRKMVLDSNAGEYHSSTIKEFTVNGDPVIQKDHILVDQDDRIVFIERHRKKNGIPDSKILYLNDEILDVNKNNAAEEVSDYMFKKLTKQAIDIIKSLEGAELVEDDIFVPVKVEF